MRLRYFSITIAGRTNEEPSITYVTSKTGTLKGYGKKGDSRISEVNIHTAGGLEILREFSARQGSDALQKALATLHCRIKSRQAREQCIKGDLEAITEKG